MLRLSKRIEYGLIALKHIAAQGDKRPCSAREISGEYDIPYDMLSKILQKLKNKRILSSVQGINGGYRMHRGPDEISLSTLFNAIEGETYISECLNEDEVNKCGIYRKCTISSPMKKIQKNINDYFNSAKLSEIV